MTRDSAGVVPICSVPFSNERASLVTKLLYGREDAAYALSISVRMLDYMIAKKEIKVRRIGGKVLIPVAELKRFAAADHAGARATQGGSKAA